MINFIVEVLVGGERREKTRARLPAVPTQGTRVEIPGFGTLTVLRVEMRHGDPEVYLYCEKW